MELNKNSKWIKFYLRFNNEYPTNFCDYFWGSLKSIVISLFLFICLILILSLLLSPILLIWYNYDNKTLLGNFQEVGICLYIIIIFTIIANSIFYYFERLQYRSKKEKQSVVKQWYLDFKNKHCTMITWK